jgi:6,7-dimethyl-8-ribityllumazine synthase
VGRSLGLFPGSYAVRINNAAAQADVRANEITNVPAGVLLVHGSTDEYYAVADNAGKQLASAHLEKPLGLFPGTYNVKLNNTSAAVTVTARVTSEVKAGAVVLQGTTDEYYAVLDSAGTQLASAHLGRPISFVPGAYRAKLNNTAMPVQVEEGRVGEYHSGSLTVATSKSGYYAVLDASGTQLVSKPVNQPVSLLPGNYSVKLGDNSRSATVTAGQSVVLNW